MRKAYTLIELLIVIFLIGLLIAMATPAILKSRDLARRGTCQNHQYELSLAIAGFEQAKNRFPGYREQIGPPGKGKPVSWAFVLLPHIERKDLYQAYGPGGAFAAETPKEWLDLFICPADVAFETSAPSSYAINCGVRDAVQSGSNGAHDLLVNGMFHDLYGSPTKPVPQSVYFRTSHLVDGARDTLMMTDRTETLTWPDLREKRLAIWWRNELNPPEAFKINGVQPPLSDSDQLDHVRPSSGHDDGVMASFADGHQQFLSAGLDYAVYVQLMTPHGAKAKMPDGGEVKAELRTATLPEGVLGE
jgi:prepilin-type N-terminal cleavage/methylation domain-containing protein